MRTVLGLDDYIIDFKITANRPDCNCFLGVAKEASVVLGSAYHPPVPTYKTVGGDIKDYIDVEVQNYDLCPRYVAVLLKICALSLRLRGCKRQLPHRVCALLIT